MTRLALIAFLFAAPLGAEVETIFENSNFTLSTPLNGNGSREWVNTNRFRTTLSLHEGAWFATGIGDAVNVLGQDYVHSAAYRAADAERSDTPFSTRGGTSGYGEGAFYLRLYRLYGGYADGTQRVSFGLQKVSMGVGRLWNPTDLFNPKNPLALEPDEVYGAFSLAYTYTLDALSQVTAVVAERRDHSFKYAGRFKGYYSGVDVALNLVEADDVSMVGYEIEGELGESGVGLRSEGGWFDEKLLGKTFFQGIVGADYTFANSFSLTGEWRYTSRTFERELLLGLPGGAPDNRVLSKGYGGAAFGYEFDALTYGTLSAVISSDDGSWFLAPLVTYSLSDDATLGAGAMLYGGSAGTEFGDIHPTYYLNVKVTF